MKLIWTDSAIQDLAEIKAYISHDSDFYATRLIEKILDGIENLLIFPEMGRKVPEAQDESIREIIYRPYRVIYKFTGTQVIIVTILNCHRDLTNPELKKWEIR